MDKVLHPDATKRRNRVTVHWSDREYYQLLRASRYQPLSVFIRQIVGQWATAHDFSLVDPPQSWYEDVEIMDLPEQENADPETKEERTHYQSLKKGGSFHDTVSV